MNYTRFLNPLSLARRPSPLREMSALLAEASPSLVFLASGVPNPQLFPFENANIILKDSTIVRLSGEKMAQALQYGPTPGYPPLIHKLKDFQRKYHNPPDFRKQNDLIISCGAQDGLCKLFEMLLNVGDYVLMQEPSYPGTLGILKPYALNYLLVDGDQDGMNPDSLRKILSRWDATDVRNAKNNVPKVIYLNPNGANPTGTSITLKRRKEIYKIAQEYDLLILEDDPYYFLQFSEILPSFLSMDTDGRVVRFDSFSKILSAGMRVGYVTGPKPILDRLNYHMQVSVLHNSSLSQVVINELLSQWGEDGFDNHVKSVQQFYESQKKLMINCAKKWLTGLAVWDEPVAGMFLWIKVLDLNDTYSMIMDKALRRDIVLVPGRHFLADSSKPSPFLRASFSLASEEKMNQGFKNLAELIREERG